MPLGTKVVHLYKHVSSDQERALHMYLLIIPYVLMLCFSLLWKWPWSTLNSFWMKCSWRVHSRNIYDVLQQGMFSLALDTPSPLQNMQCECQILSTTCFALQICSCCSMLLATLGTAEGPGLWAPSSVVVINVPWKVLSQGCCGHKPARTSPRGSVPGVA